MLGDTAGSLADDEGSSNAGDGIAASGVLLNCGLACASPADAALHLQVDGKGKKKEKSWACNNSQKRKAYMGVRRDTGAVPGVTREISRLAGVARAKCKRFLGVCACSGDAGGSRAGGGDVSRLSSGSSR